MLGRCPMRLEASGRGEVTRNFGYHGTAAGLKNCILKGPIGATIRDPIRALLYIYLYIYIHII